MQNLLRFIVAMQLRVQDFKEDRGATATEYALLVSFIALAILVGVTAFGGSLNTFFTGLAARVTK